MKMRNMFYAISFLVIFSLIFAAGCGPEAPITKTEQLSQEPVELRLESAAGKSVEAQKSEVETKPAAEEKTYNIGFKPAKGQSEKYRYVSESVQSVEWIGLPEKESLPSGRNFTRVEMVFGQKVADVNENGITTYQITIDQLKMRYESDGRLIRDFDSLRGNEPASDLAKLVGKSYTIEKAADGKVISIDASQAKSVFTDKQRDSMALKLLEDKAIEARHGVALMPKSGESEMKIGGTWSGIETFDFGLMGQKSFEKIYKIKDVSDGKAAVTMQGIPSSEMAQQLHQNKGKDMSGMFSSTSDYQGEMLFDLKGEKISNYKENLEVKWTAVDLANKKNDAPPTAMTMGAMRKVMIERID